METNPARIWVRSLASLNGLWIRCFRKLRLGCRWGSDLTVLWLWHRAATVAPIQPLGWELLYAAGMVRKEKKRKENFRLPEIVSIRMQVQSLASLSGLRMQHRCKLWCKSQMPAQIQCCCGCGIGQQVQLQFDP